MWTLLIVTTMTTMQMSATSLDVCRMEFQQIKLAGTVVQAECRNFDGDTVALVSDQGFCWSD